MSSTFVKQGSVSKPMLDEMVTGDRLLEVYADRIVIVERFDDRWIVRLEHGAASVAWVVDDALHYVQLYRSVATDDTQ